MIMYCRQSKTGSQKVDEDMLWTIAAVLVVLWVLGLVTSYTVGGFIHILIVLAVVVVLIRVIQGRRIDG
jgi:asparagine N-glycosylation enzyme membrane subunit Stt3